MEEEREKRKLEITTIEEESDTKKRKTTPLESDYYNKIMLQKVKLKYNVLKKERRPKLLKLKQPILDDKKNEIEKELNRQFQFLKALDMFSYQDTYFLYVLIVAETEIDNERLHIKFEFDKSSFDRTVKFVGALDQKSPQEPALWF